MWSEKRKERSMTRRARARLALMVGLSALALAVPAWADDDDEIPFAAAKLIIETNATDGDAGIQVFLDGEPWKKVKIYNPCGDKIFQVKGKGVLKSFGLTELFFESNEPSFDELPLNEILGLFPEGEYEFEGETVDGATLEGEATLTHVIPVGPEIVAPVSASDEPPVVDPDHAVIQWEPVEDTIAGSGLEIVGYQVIVEEEESSLVFSVLLPGSATRVSIPPEFLEHDTEYKFEILAIEASGNQTITEREFVTASEP